MQNYFDCCVYQLLFEKHHQSFDSVLAVSFVQIFLKR